MHTKQDGKPYGLIFCLFLSACIVATVSVAAAPAEAAQLHAFSAGIGSAGAGAGRVSLHPMETRTEGGRTVWRPPGSGVAVDRANGDIYLADSGNHRIDEFEPDGTFVRAFGWEVDSASPASELQSCTILTGCQAGSAGSEPGQLGAPTFVVADDDPSSPSYGDLYVASGVGVPGVDERQRVNVGATGGTFTLSFEGETTAPIPFNAIQGEVREALEALPAIGAGNVVVSGAAVHVEGGTFQNVNFTHTLGEADVPQMTADGSGLTGTAPSVEILSESTGSKFFPEVITKYGPQGELVESWGESGQLLILPVEATGSGDLAEGAAHGTGDLTSGSTAVTNVSTENGEFKVGQQIEGPGIPVDSHLTAVGAGTLTLSQAATTTASAASLRSNSRMITNVGTGTGAFKSGQEIRGAGLPAHTLVDEVGPTYLVLNTPATASGSGIALSASRPLGSEFIGLALGAGGRLAVGANQRAWLFDQAAAFLEEVPLGGFWSAANTGLALDAAGDIYGGGSENTVALTSPAGLDLGALYTTPRFTAEGGSESHFRSITAFARDPGIGDVYVDEGSSIQDISGQCEPSVNGCSSSQEFGAGQLSGGAGLTVSSDGTVYAADTEDGRIASFRVSLEANTGTATEVEAKSALLHATVDPRGGEVTTCRFQYGRSKTYGRTLPCLNGAGEEVGTESTPITETIQLHAEASGLKPGATYHFRLRARNSTGEEIHSEDVELETIALPLIEAAEAGEITAESATLKAKINPEGPAVTSCEVEWGTSTAYGGAVPCEPPSLPAGAEPVPIDAHLTGLQGQTTYHWRVVARDENGTEDSTDHTFVFLPGPPGEEVDQECGNEALREANGSTALADCRAYEMVTPQLKNGATVGTVFNAPPTSASEDGSRLMAPTLQCFGGASSCGAVRQTEGATYEFSRSASGWQATPLTAPAGLFTASTVLLESPDAPDQLLSVALPSTPPAPGREWLYGLGSGGSLSPIGPVAAAPGYFKGSYFGGLAVTADLSHFVYQASTLFWPAFDQSTGDSIYEYAGQNEEPFLVAVSGGKGSTDLISTCGSSLVGKEENRNLSADGRTVYFVVRPCAGGSGANAGIAVPQSTIYARIDGESADARTVKISGPAPEPACDSSCQAQPPASVEFAGDSADGSKFYFSSTQQLTDDATEGSENLYLYSDPQEQPLTGDHLTDVSAGDTSGQGPRVQGVMAVSPDGSRAYFVAKGLLAGANGEGVEPEEGQNNLYVYDAEEGATRFVATLPGGEPEQDQWASGIKANVTADGRYLLFTSRGALTPDATREGGPAQAYRYDAAADRLTRVSIGQLGFNDNGNAGSGAAEIAPASKSLYGVSGRPPLNPSMSSDGARVFFESPIGLTPSALDDVAINSHGALAENIYEWEQEGTGGCVQPAGCVYLISDGRDSSEAPDTQSSVALVGTDASGENVFFFTTDPLVPADGDTGVDIYDARVGGGFAPPPNAVPCETSEACHGEGTSEGPLQSAVTANFQGPEEGSGHPEKHKRHHKHKRHRKHKKHKKRAAKRANRRQGDGK
jgi:hypothetical protein